MIYLSLSPVGTYRGPSRIQFVLFLFLCFGPSKLFSQINKKLVDAAPKEEWAPMPHIIQGDSSVMKIKQDKSNVLLI